MDLQIEWDSAAFRGDWAVTPGDLALGVDVQTAVLLSLFTDRIAPPDWMPPVGSPGGRRGWWGDSYEPSPIGSRLWTLNRAVKTDGTTLLAMAKDYCNEALQWLVDSSVAASISVVTFWASRRVIGIAITVTAPKSPPQTFSYQWAWQPQAG